MKTEKTNTVIELSKEVIEVAVKLNKDIAKKEGALNEAVANENTALLEAYEATFKEDNKSNRKVFRGLILKASYSFTRPTDAIKANLDKEYEIKAYDRRLRRLWDAEKSEKAPLTNEEIAKLQKLFASSEEAKEVAKLIRKIEKEWGTEEKAK